MIKLFSKSAFINVALAVYILLWSFTDFLKGSEEIILAGTAAGDFTASEYPKVKIKMKELWDSEFMMSHVKRDCPVFNCITKKQNINITNKDAQMRLMDQTVCDGVEVTFLRACDMGVEDCADMEGDDACDWDGEEICSDSVFYEPNSCFRTTFKVRDKVCKDMFDKVTKISESMMNKLAAMDQELEKRMITFLIACADDLSGLDLPTGGLNGETVWEIDKSEFNAELVIDFMCLLENIGLNNACMVTGKNFYRDYKKKDARKGDGCCHFDALLDQFDVCANIRDVDSLAGAPSSFLVAPGAVAYINKVRWDSTTPINQKDDKNTHTYRVKSPKLTWRNGSSTIPVYYDVRWRRCCVTAPNGDFEFEEKFEIRHNGTFMHAPDNCDGLRGVIHIQQACADC